MIILPEQLKDNEYIDPIKIKYDSAEYWSNSTIYLAELFFVYNWNLSLKEKYVLIEANNKQYKLKNQVINDNVISLNFILPFYKDIFFSIWSSMKDTYEFSINEGNRLIVRFKLSFKQLMNNIHQVVESIYIDEVNKDELQKYLSLWIKQIKPILLLIKLAN